MDLKNKNAAVVIQPVNIAQKIAELGVNYERQFKNIIPGFIIAQPFVHEREIDNTLEEIQQSFSYQGFVAKTDLVIRKGEYKFEIGVVPKEVKWKKIIWIDLTLFSGFTTSYRRPSSSFISHYGN